MSIDKIYTLSNQCKKKKKSLLVPVGRQKKTLLTGGENNVYMSLFHVNIKRDFVTQMFFNLYLFRGGFTECDAAGMP